MISTLISLALSVGLPAIVTGILGKYTSWLGGISTLAPFVGVVVKLCVSLIDSLMLIINWLVKKILVGLDHIVQSVPATMTVLLLMWVSYVYGSGIPSMVDLVPSFERRVEEPTPTPRTRTEIRTPGDWLKEALGVE